MAAEGRGGPSRGASALEEDDDRWLVPLPQGAKPPVDVFVSGVPQAAGVDYDLERRDDVHVLAFRRPLEQEGRLGFWRWTLMFFAIAGTYRRHDSVDVRYVTGGQQRVATGLEVVPPRGARADPSRGGSPGGRRRPGRR